MTHFELKYATINYLFNVAIFKVNINSKLINFSLSLLIDKKQHLIYLNTYDILKYMFENL